MATWKKVIVSGSQAELATLGVDSSLIVRADVFEFTGSVRVTGGGITGSLLGTSSFAVSASWSPGSALSATASYVLSSNVDGPLGKNSVLSASNAGTASTSLVTNTTTGTGPYYVTFVDATSGNVPLRVDSNILTFNATTNVLTVSSSNALSSSTALSASTSTQVANSLTAGAGLTGTTFNGSVASTFDVGAGALITVLADAVQVSTSSLTTNQIPKFSSNALAGSNISDTGTQVQIAAGASSGLSVAAGGVTVTGNSTFNNNLTVAGDLTVAGTASFQNTQNLLIGDRFAAFASGSTSLTDGGIIVVSATGAGGMSGSALFIESTNTGTYGRFATQYNVHVSASTTVNADEFIVTAKINQGSNPSADPTWGGSGNGSGNMWITTGGEIFIYA